VTKRLLFVCLGNICRSPAAEAVAVRLASELGIDASVDSAGTIAAHVGHPPDPRMKAAGELRGYQFLTKARKVTPADLVPGCFDLVVAMDQDNLADLRRLMGGRPDHIRLFGEFLDAKPPANVPDPYYGGPDGFETVLDMLEAGCPKILQSLLVI